MSSYKDLMLEPTKALFEKHKYNDDIEYLKSDDFSYKSEIEHPDTVINEMVEGVAKEHLDFEYEMIDYKKADLSHLTGTVEEVELEITTDFFKNFANVEIDENDPITEENRIKLSQASYDGIRYYCKTDLLIVPQAIKSYIFKNNTLKCKVSVYNYKYCQEGKKKIFKCKDIKVPELKFTAIPKKINYAKLKKPLYKILPNGASVLYTNIPREYYTKICVDNETLAYNINKECFVGHSNCNQTKINHLCYDVAKNGFQKVIQLKLLDGGRLVPYFSNKRVLIGEYLNYPTLPVAIVLDMYSYPKNLLFYESEDMTSVANLCLEPYFIL